MLACSTIEHMTLNYDAAIDASELELMREIARDPVQTQRDLSRGSGLSLGMTNLLIKRLARKGLIKISQLDWKRTQYLLTPKGALEKTRKTYDYARYTVRLFRQLQENLATALRKEHAAGQRAFWFVAQDEFEGVLRETLEDINLPGARVHFAAKFSEIPKAAAVVFAATQESIPARPGWIVISLVDFLNARYRLR